MKGGALGAFGEHAIQRFRLVGSVGEADAADAGNIPKIGFIMF